MDKFNDTAEEENVDIKNLIFKFLSQWYWFAFSLITALIIAYAFNHWSQRIFEIKTSILIKDEQTVLDSRFSSGLGIYNTQYRISNEIGILKSYQLTERALDRLDFEIDYFVGNRFFDVDLYKASPFRVVIDTSASQPVNATFNLTFISPDEFKLSIHEENVGRYSFRLNKRIGQYAEVIADRKYKLFEKIKTNEFAFTVVPQNVENPQEFIGKKLSFRINPPADLVKRYRNFNVTADKSSSIITIALRGGNIDKMVDFLNTLTDEYLKKGIERKDLIAENTIKFIDTQVGEISDSLNYSETKLQN
ncbi:MAG TPA: hypothetical protein VHO90_00700, partial [Bacteroidales bacterium]|nr:hypothetical protein [Bacteroidales bacterium]